VFDQTGGQLYQLPLPDSSRCYGIAISTSGNIYLSDQAQT
jgi:hypothetical protein